MRVPPGPVTNAIAMINIAIAVILLWPGLWEQAVLAGGLFPARFSQGDAAFANIPYLLPFWVTPITSAFLHGGILHLVLNMLMLMLMGRMTERVLGWQGFMVIYGAGMISAAAAEIIAHPSSMTPVIGASGAISAIIAAYLLLFPNSTPKAIGPIPPVIARPVTLLAMWTLINLMVGFVAPGIGLGIAIYAHIGGFLAGLLLSRPMLLWRYRTA